jgi:hypothetical protein
MVLAGLLIVGNILTAAAGTSALIILTGVLEDHSRSRVSF